MKTLDFMFLFMVLLFGNGASGDALIAERTVRHSGTFTQGDYSASNAVDGNPSTCSLAAEQNENSRDAIYAWFQIDLGVPFVLTSLTLSNSKSNSQYLVNFAIYIANTNSTDGQSSAWYTYSNGSSVANNANVTIVCSANPMRGRYVTVRRQGGNRHDALSLCEIKVDAILSDYNLDLKSLSTNQTGAYNDQFSDRAVDDSIESCAQPEAPEGSNGWWSVDLSNIYIITSVIVCNGNTVDGGSSYLSYFNVKVGLNADVNGQTLCYNYNDVVPPGGNATLNCSTPLIGRYVSVFRYGGSSPYDNAKSLYLCEIYITGQTYSENSTSQSTSPLITSVSANSSPSQTSVPSTISTPTSTVPFIAPTQFSTTTSASSRFPPPISNSTASFPTSITAVTSTSNFNPNDTASIKANTVDASRDEGRKKNIIICVVVIVGGLLLLAAAAVILFFCIRKKRFSQGSSTISKLANIVSIKPPVPPRPKPEIGPMKELLRQPIAAELIADHVSRKKLDQDGFKKEFEKLPKENKETIKVGQLSGNSRKNRFKNILPYDHTLVQLDIEESDEPDATYINANYITGYKNISKMYIASQGPKAETLNDFWRMIWQQNVDLIVMTTKIMESGKQKCEKYWPGKVNETKTFRKISVQLMLEETYANHVYREMIVCDERKKNGQRRNVRHMQFLKWEDKTKPEHCLPILHFRKRVQALQRNTSGPVVLHCSAGVGRTGTYIALDILLEQLQKEGEISFFSCVENLRQQRMEMVQTWKQYHFLHEAVLDQYLTGQTAIQCATFLRDYADLILPKPDGSKLEEQFKLLQKLKDRGTDKESAGTQHENLSKNRNQSIFAYDDARLYLETSRHNENDYINAVYVDGYRSNETCILTQLPLKETIVDFWRMIWDYQLKTIILLNEIESNEKNCPKYWPEDSEADTYGSIEVTAASTTADCLPSVVSREFTVAHTDEKSKAPFTLRQYQVSGWKDTGNVPSSPHPFLGLIDQLTGIISSNDSIVIQCTDGATRSGLFAAAMYVVDMMKTEEVVDVFLACRFIAINRPQVIDSQDQYKFLYELAFTHLNDMDSYSNSTPKLLLHTNNAHSVYANA